MPLAISINKAKFNQQLGSEELEVEHGTYDYEASAAE